MNPIHAERKLRGWSRPTMARNLRDAADDPRDVTSIESLVHNIHRWEGGGVWRERAVPASLLPRIRPYRIRAFRYRAAKYYHRAVRQEHSVCGRRSGWR